MGTKTYSHSVRKLCASTFIDGQDTSSLVQLKQPLGSDMTSFGNAMLDSMANPTIAFLIAVVLQKLEVFYSKCTQILRLIEPAKSTILTEWSGKQHKFEWESMYSLMDRWNRCKGLKQLVCHHFVNKIDAETLRLFKVLFKRLDTITLDEICTHSEILKDWETLAYAKTTGGDRSDQEIDSSDAKSC